MQTVVHGERVSPHYLVHAGTAEPLRVSLPEAVAYLLELEQHWRQYTRGVRKVVDISASTTPLSIRVYPILTEIKV